MTNDTYPASKRTRLQLEVVEGNPHPDPVYGGTRQQYEEWVFRNADHFNVVRFTSHSGSQIMMLKSFASAVYVASENERSLLYAVSSKTGDAFCVVRDEWPKYAELTLELRSKGHGANTLDELDPPG